MALQKIKVILLIFHIKVKDFPPKITLIPLILGPVKLLRNLQQTLGMQMILSIAQAMRLTLPMTEMKSVLQPL